MHAESKKSAKRGIEDRTRKVWEQITAPHRAIEVVLHLHARTKAGRSDAGSEPLHGHDKRHSLNRFFLQLTGASSIHPLRCI